MKLVFIHQTTVIPLWTTGVRSKKFVRNLLQRMEQIEGLVVKNKERIFREAGR